MAKRPPPPPAPPAVRNAAEAATIARAARGGTDRPSRDTDVALAVRTAVAAQAARGLNYLREPFVAAETALGHGLEYDDIIGAMVLLERDGFRLVPIPNGGVPTEFTLFW